MKPVVKYLCLPFAAIIPLFFFQCQGTDVYNEPFETEYFIFPEDRSAFPNPERGWYMTATTEKASKNSMSWIKDENASMVLLESNIGGFLTGELSQQKIDEIDSALSYAAQAGLSVIFRAAYTFAYNKKPEPEDINIILGHIGQLKPVFYKHEDILFNVQAGFLGPWGEWHSSYYGDKIRPEIQQQVMEALLDAVPESVTVAVRRPEYVRTVNGNQTLTADEAFNGSTVARAAYHNDAFMSDETDMDTYSERGWSRDAELAWIHNHTRFTPFIAETNAVSRYNDVNNAIETMDYQNIQSLNIEYHPKVINKWRKGKYGGMNAFDYITNKIGYRFIIRNVRLAGEIQPGGILQLDLDIVNKGFGHLLKEKKFEIVLKNGNSTYRTEIAEDARFWNKNEPVIRNYSFDLPSGIQDGEWDVYLGLSSTFASLASNPAYSVRFANKDIWDEKLGLNRIGIISVTAGEETGEESGVEKEFKQIFP